MREKTYMDESEIVCWHYNHNKDSDVKGIIILRAFYVAESENGLG
jgi:hypothetical protein